MTHYLIEFRFHGKAKYEIKKLVYEINRKFNLRTKRAIPHISLAGPFYTGDEKKLIRDFNQLCSKNPLMNFEIDGFSTFDNSKVVFLDVVPSIELEDFRWALAKTLKPYCKLRPFDYERNFAFHSTIAMKLSTDKFERIKEYINKKKKLNFKHVVVRATLLKGSIILREYDFLLRRSLIRSMAKDKRIYYQTLDLLKGHFEKKFNSNEFTNETIKAKKKSFVDKVKRLFSKPKIFITSDLHLDHINIIKYCKRPFINIADMNKTLIDNWNNIVSEKDTVYFLGDLGCGGGSKSTDYWLKQLKGKIIFIKGNHDRSKKIKFYESYTLNYKNYKFFLTHKPEQVPNDWNGWVICGHHHNNKIQEYPFINKINKKINVSVELTKYRPVDIDEIIKKIEE